MSKDPAWNEVHREPAGQVALYQREDRYFAHLRRLFGERFLQYRRRWEETSRRGDPGDYPLSLDLALNSGCQLSCLMCPLPSRPEGRKVRPLADELLERLLAEAGEHGLPALTLGLGSEPLLHPQPVRWVRRAGQAGIMDIRLGTNGLLLHDRLLAELVDSPLTRLEISVDAARPETYRQVRGGDLGRLERIVERFLEIRAGAGRAGPLLRLSFLKLPANRGELEPFLARWGDRADMISVQEPIWFPGARLERPDRPVRPLAPVCAQSWQRLAVAHDGRYWPCCSWYGEGLLTQTAAEAAPAAVWRSREMEELRARLSGPPEGFPAPCAQCEF